AAVGGDQAALRNRKAVAGVRKGDALDADVRLVALRGREDLLLSGDLDGVMGGIVVVVQADVQRHAVRLDPYLSGVGLELFEQRGPMDVGKEVEGAGGGSGELAGPFDRLQRLSIHKHQAAAAE